MERIERAGMAGMVNDLTAGGMVDQTLSVSGTVPLDIPSQPVYRPAIRYKPLKETFQALRRAFQAYS